MIKAFFKVDNKECSVEITNMDGVEPGGDTLRAEGCMARLLGRSIYDVTYIRFELIDIN